MADEQQNQNPNPTPTYPDIDAKKLVKIRPDSLTPEEKKHIAAFRWSMIFVCLSLALIGVIIWTIVMMVQR